MIRSSKYHVLTVTVIVSFIAIIGKLIGFLREAVIAAFFGATSATDAFFFAQSMPAMIFPAVCSSISTAFITMYVTKLTQEGEEEGGKFASHSLAATLLLAILLSLLALLLTPYIVALLAPGFSGDTLSLAIFLTRIVMGSFVLIMAQYMFGAILNARKFFYGVQVAGLLFNIFVIAVTLLLGKGQSIVALTITVVAGHLVQVIILVIFCRRRAKTRIALNPFHADVKGLMVLAVPILLGNSIVQLQVIVDKILASLLQEGTISALSYAGSLNTIVTGVFVVSLSTVLYPTLTENAAMSDMKMYSKNLMQSISGLILVLVPISLITMIFATDIVSAVFERGSFDRTATELTSTALFCYAIMYTFIAIRSVLTNAFYAIKDTRTPMINSSIGVASHIVCSIVLSRYIGIAGIALGASLSSIIAASLLLRNVCKAIPDLSLAGLLPLVKKVILAGIITGAVLYFFAQSLSVTQPFIRFILATMLGFSVYGGMLMLLRCRELMALVSVIGRKLRRK